MLSLEQSRRSSFDQMELGNHQCKAIPGERVELCRMNAAGVLRADGSDEERGKRE